MPAYDHDDYVSFSMEFRCNLRCVHCMIEGTMDRLRPEPAARFDALLERQRETRGWKGLILTGSEITLRADLPKLARRARAAGFERVRIQTHGMGLAKPEFLDGLIEAGVNEYFVSVTAADAQTHDAITLARGSFERTLEGLALLDARSGVHVSTNTVVTTRSYAQLPDVVARLAHLRNLARMEFWVFLPMREDDPKDLIAPVGEILPYLRRAVADARALGRDVEIKNFPPCLLGQDGDLVVNDQPELFIDPAFWPEFMRNGFHQCVHRDRCGATDCLGLSTAYIRKFGWEAERLRPLPRPTPVRAAAVAGRRPDPFR